MIASYPMYSLPQSQPSVVTWWQHILKGLKNRGIELNVALTNVDTALYKHWLDPQLFFSQTCGYPLTTVLKHKVKLIGTPVYDCEYCQHADYCSLFIVRSTDEGNSIEDFAGKRFAFNATDSQSGYNAVITYLTERGISIPFFGKDIVSGQHKNSIAAVASGEADICAVDSVIYSLLQRHQPETLKNVRILTMTKLTPGLPFITSINTPDKIIEVIFDTIKQTCENKSLHNCNSNLLIKGISKIPLGTYIKAINIASKPVDRL